MCPGNFFFFFIFLPILAVVAVISVMQYFSSRSFQVKFVQDHGGRIRTPWLNNRWVTDIDGQEVDFAYIPRSKNTPSRLEVSVKGGFFAHVLFRRENDTDRFAKGIGLNQEIQVFDLPFDDAVYVECEDRDFITRLLAGSEVKNYIQDILRTMASLEINGNRCVMKQTPCDELMSVNTDELMAVARSMVVFSQRIPLPGPGEVSSTPVTEECRRWTGFFTGFSVALSVAGFISIMWGLLAFEPLMPGKLFVSSLYVALPLASMALFYMFQQFKGLSVALPLFRLSAIFTVTGAVLLCWGGGMVLNGSQDVSKPALHEVQVIDKYITHSKNGTAYHIRVDAWDVRSPYYRFTVPSAEYDRIRPGTPCTVTTKTGLFGFEWILSHVCHPVRS